MKSNLDTVSFTYNISGLKTLGNPMKDSQVIESIARHDKKGVFLEELNSLPYLDKKSKVRCDIKLLVKLSSGNNYQVSETLIEVIRLLSKHYNTEE
jgi:hypothetical protein